MLFSWMWRRIGLITTNVSEEIIASIFRVERMRELAITLTVTSRLITLFLATAFFPPERWRR
jgi:hypothetical protein